VEYDNIFGSTPTGKPRVIWRTEFRQMEHSGWSKWWPHKGYASEEARAEALEGLERSRDALHGWIEFRPAPDADPED